MTAVFHVGSRSQSDLVVPVEGRGHDLLTARRTAVQFARSRHRIPDPILLDNNHEAAVRLRQEILAQHRVKMGNLNGSPGPWWKARDRFPCYDEK
ncbi:MAG: hypothetical protein A3H72_03980 [Candidatus Doudnabacteria bacterium RIFCSPLOWO2_02_FULL_48_8]|uniref:Uncharacterized protein n=1 Tax=Candidatus Doudnabacteria bacterium RIFCSPHIGHO2_01_FULL_46_24 TaxID=1817825 RepID=A0A1F5NVU7_9BACT|nr:MAG: hypothetical protein A2720_02190 [Candidatus Doudnabacteria bacterium RIFCSPHIGHO2_01_FULL_46_24]OGE95157.1 MAG: hypothetical protein A3H72_03980 [Candidatus Doudnabacteria bacterium RIFCSPLOWO2_02_FULL_48_8]OGE95540.1 MAG: hypothetical protein A3E98_01870 [Candidatus Doudnabacteria bacterium RIFCSPHIGHO2_12_FULL_48_11]